MPDVRDKYGDGASPYLADSDRAWFRATVAAAAAAAPKHRSTVLWDSDRFGVPHFKVHCLTCGSLMVGVDKKWLQMQATEHEVQA